MQRLDSLQSRQWPPGTTYDSIYYLGEMAELQFLSGKIKLDDNSKWKGHRIKRFGDKIVLVADGVNEQNLSGIKIPHFEWNNVAPNALGIHGYIYNVTGVDQHTSTRLLKIYFANVHPILPVINKIEFLKQYRDQTETYPSGELLNAMFGAAARFVECEYLEPDRLKKVPKDTIWDVPMGWSDHFFNQAQDIVSRWTVNPTSSKIQAIVLIHNHRGNLDSKSSACWLMGGFAIRLAQMLGLHRNCDDWDISDSEKETRKRLWWALYVSDRFQSALQGKPLSIQDENDVGYPNASATWKEVLDEGDTDIIGPRFPSATYQPQDTNGTVEIYQLFIQFVKLSEILGRIIQGLYSPKMQNAWSKGSMDGLVTRLDHELTEWRFSFSRALRQSRNEDFDEHTGYFTPVTASMLLFYFSALILLHRPFIQFSATGKPISKSSFSSFQICTSAATRGIRIAAGLSIHDFLLCPYSFSLYPVMQCCLIHIYNTRSTDTQISRAAKLDLNRGMDLLDKLQYMSSSAKKLNILLRNIIDNNNIPPSNRDTSLSPLVNVINRTSTSSSSESLPQNKENTIDQSTFHTSTTTPSVSSFLDTNLIQNWQNRQTKSSSFAGNEDQYYQEAYTLQQFGFTAPTKEKNDQKSTLSKFQTFENNDDSLISPLSSTKSQSDNISAVSFAPIQQPTDILDDVLFKYDQNNPFWNIPSSMNWEEWNEWLEKSIDPM
ncbi:fungal-specific transcription factor domain-containing protein [Halteromyces radiatus]|uniref:fungal-specific transcription factor domain-containing protein n=1 Tax=Halteromyces radiatus TaxID=101107 RepID=UPI002220BA63|nr:fungal-specific transcription factor domain-containing protein [Halteromyces radiatus]KAI8089729.1 fungal-specific transcription factor domain-containing protein [Halteromyces radiatus]